MDELMESVELSQRAFTAGAFATVIIGLIVCFLMAHFLRNRLGRVKSLPALLVAGHLLAYALLLYAWGGGSPNASIINAAVILLSVMPALLVISAFGKPRRITMPDAESAEKPDTANGKPGINDEQVAAGEGIPPEPGQPPTFGLGLIKGLWAFVAIWVFYLFYVMSFSACLGISKGLLPE
jgi:L-lactate permease